MRLLTEISAPIAVIMIGSRIFIAAIGFSHTKIGVQIFLHQGYDE